VEVELQSFVTTAVYGSQWSGSRPSRLPSGKDPHGTQRREGRVGPRVKMGSVGNRNLSRRCTILNHAPSIATSDSCLLHSLQSVFGVHLWCALQYRSLKFSYHSWLGSSRCVTSVTITINTVWHTTVYICLHTVPFVLKFCQYTTCFGSAEPSSGTCINVKNTDL
jgi:hypothetical protein